MEIEFDPAKDAANIRKHGVSLREADTVLAHAALDVADDRVAYGEARRIAFARRDGRWWACGYVARGSAMRVITLHRVREKEVMRWLDRSSGSG